jgi:cyclase
VLKTRIIPTLLWCDFGLVKGVGFDSWRRIGTVLPAVRVYNRRRVDELIVVDITASREGRAPDFHAVSDFAADCFMPLTIGGGIREVRQVRELLRAGADKVAINSAAYENPQLVRDVAGAFGSQCVVASLDARCNHQGKRECWGLSGTRPTGVEAGEWARELQRLGAGEILVTSVERDGTMTGYDLELIRRVCDQVSIPVIAAGGAGSYHDMYLALTEGGAQAVSAASMFHFTEQTPEAAKKYLAARGICVRL